MAARTKGYDPDQRMTRPDFELRHKVDQRMSRVPLHHHDFYEIYFLVTGDVTYTIDSKLCRVLPGDILFVSPRELHKVRISTTQDPYERYVLWITPRYLRRLSTGRTDLARCLDPGREGYRNRLRVPPEDQRAVGALAARLYEEQQGEGYGRDLMPESLLVQLLVTLNRLADRDAAAQEDPARSSQLVSQAAEYIGAHCGESMSLDDLAERFFVSKYYLSHEFNRIMGVSVHRYILKKRLLTACQLMARGARPGQVWADCGFGDYTGFYRAFRAEYGVSPRDYAQSVRD